MRKNIHLHTTMLIFVQNDQVLLGYKNRGFAAGTYNGFGGKVEPNETILSALIRECKEEGGFAPVDPKPVGTINYDEVMKGKRQNIQMHIYTCTKIDGIITPSTEMTPQFSNIDNLPISKLLPDTAIWLPLILKGFSVNADFILNDDLTIKSYTLNKNLL